MSELTADRLREIVSYNSETGEFTWLSRPVTHWCHKAWNAQWAGNVVGLTIARSSSHPGCKHYALIRLSGRAYGAHRLAWLFVTGVWPVAELDHRNNNPLDNRICNLREATHAENQRNKGPMSNNRLGIKGVSYSATRLGLKKYKAQIKHDKKTKHIGWFETAELASAAYVVVAQRLHGEFLHKSQKTEQ